MGTQVLPVLSVLSGFVIFYLIRNYKVTTLVTAFYGLKITGAKRLNFPV